MSASLLALAGCAGDPAVVPPSRIEVVADAAEPALAYLSSTTEAVGPDVVVAMLVYAGVSQSAMAESQAERRLRLIPAEAADVFGVAFGTEHDPLPAAVLNEEEIVGAGLGAPDPAMSSDDRDQECPIAALQCEVSPECEEYLRQPFWGYPLTHQALTLVFLQWAGCPDEDAALRQALALRLVTEQRFDSAPSDLGSERIAMLGQLGYGENVEEEWIDSLMASQEASGGFRWEAGEEVAAHPTGMALWAMASWARAE